MSWPHANGLNSGATDTPIEHKNNGKRERERGAVARWRLFLNGHVFPRRWKFRDVKFDIFKENSKQRIADGAQRLDQHSLISKKIQHGVVAMWFH